MRVCRANEIDAMAATLLTAALGYGLGLLPSATIAARLAGRRSGTVIDGGTGNPGALNSAHTLGKKWGAAVAVADIGKGVAAGLAGGALAGSAGANAAACGAVIGHCYPATRDFAGGKGVATSVGQVLATFPVYLPLDIAVAGTTAALPFWKQRTMAANTLASAVWVAASTMAWRKQLPNFWGPPPTIALPIAAAASSAVIFKRFLDERASVQEFRAGNTRWAQRVAAP